MGRDGPVPAGTLTRMRRTVDVMETVVRVELGVARTLEALSLRGGSEAGTRRLGLAREAIGGANTAIDRSRSLQREASRLTARGEGAGFRPLLERAARVLAGLAAAERDIADTLLSTPGPDGSELAVQRRQLAYEAWAGARRATARARLLRELAETGAAPGK